MKDLLLLLAHLLTTLAKLLGPGGAKAIVANSLLMKQQLLIINRSRQRAPNLTPIDRMLLGFWSLFLNPHDIQRAAVILRPSTLLNFHDMLKKRMYRLLYTSRRKGKPGPKGPSQEFIDAIVEMKRRNLLGEDGRLAVSVKAPAAIPSDTVQNPSDPDASYNTHRGVGYLVQVMETYTDNEPAGNGDAAGLDLITHIAVHKMTKHDSQALEPALDDVAGRGVEPVVILGDSHYGSTNGVQRIAERGAEVLAPAMPPKGYKLGRLTLEDFELDTDGIVVRCPAGNLPVDTSVGKSKIEIRFEQSLCCACLDRHRCPGYANPTTSWWQYTPARVAQYRRRFSQQSDEFKDRYRWRAGIEATMSRLKHQMGLAKLRVRGKTSVKYAVFMRALGLNIRRAAAYSA